MNRARHITQILTLFISYSSGYTQELIQYKQVDTTKLFIEIYKPDTLIPQKKYAAIVFFFGGGWKEGDRSRFAHHAKYFSQRGMICLLVDYRIEGKHKTTPFESLKDAKSAMRFVRANAKKFHMDSSKIVACGASAGGHLAAATALIDDYDDDTDDLSLSCKPNALVLFNPVIDNGPGGYAYHRIGNAYKSFSPLHNIRKGAPPTILLIGTEDIYIPVETVQYYKTVMEAVGSRCDLRIYEGKKHAFFNYRYFEYFEKTTLEVDYFLQSLGYINNEVLVGVK